MNYESFKSWLEAYGRAWENRNPLAAATLFTDDAVYYWGPFDEPLRGRSGISRRWSEATSRQERISFTYEILTVTEKMGINRWWASFLRIPSKKVELDGIFLVSLDEKNLCTEFREWWNAREFETE